MSGAPMSTDKPAERDGGGAARFRYEYGAGPLHLLSVLASFALASYALLRIFENPTTGRVLLWLGAAVILHDLIAYPLYSAVMRIAQEGASLAIAPRARFLLAFNHVRIPAALSLLLLLVWFPLILRIDPANYEVTTGIAPADYLGRWLLISGVIFLISAVHLAFALRRGPREVPQAPARSAAPERVGIGWRIAAWMTLATMALLVLWVTAIAVYGLLDSGFGFDLL